MLTIDRNLTKQRTDYTIYCSRTGKRSKTISDVIIRNGWLIDGTGNPRYRADIVLEGERIAGIGQFPKAKASIDIDAGGKIVSPGFIDAHSHSDKTLKLNPNNESTIRQGVTSEVVGNCGGSQVRMAEDVDNTFGEYLASVQKIGTSANFAWLIGHNTLRKIAGVQGENVSPDQMEKMKAILRQSLEEGAIGLSTGLEFDPGRNAKFEEVLELVKVVKEYDGMYTSHIRNRADNVLPALDEFINTIGSSDCRGQVSHMNIRYNTGAPDRAFEQCVDKIEKARAKGFEVLADMTPLNYGTGGMAAILPPWVLAEGKDKAVEYLKDPKTRKRLRTDCDRYWRFIHNGEWDRVRMQSNSGFPEVNGMEFLKIAELWKKDPWDCYFDILAASRVSGSLYGRLFTDEHLKETISNPLYMLAMDGNSTTIEEPLSKYTAIPLHFMGMTYFLTHHVRTVHTLSLEEAIRKMTSMTATHFRLKDRGLLRKGMFADLVVFDFEKLDTVSTFEKPLAYVKGVEHVFVNGAQVIDRMNHTGIRSGKNLFN